MLKTLVKASHITNLTDARYFAALEVEWLGFNLEVGSETYMNPQKIMAIKEWVEGPKIVGEFGMQDVATIKSAIETIQFDAIQLGHFSGVSHAMLLTDVPIIKEFVIEDKLDVDAIGEHLFTFSSYVDTFLLSGSLKWSGIKEDSFAIEFLKTICEKYQVVLAIDIQPSDVLDFLEKVKPYGIGVTGGEEEAVGVKSFDELDELFEVIMVEETY